KMETVLRRTVQPFTESNLKIPKTVTLTKLTPVKTEENIISKLKKLPGITLDLVKSEPIFKIPKVPKLKKSNNKQIITSDNKSKVVFEKNLSLKKQNDSIIDKNIVIIDTIDLTNCNSNVNKTSKKKKELNSDQIIPKYLKSSSLKYLYSEKENKQITSSPNKFLKNNCTKTKPAHSKTIKSVEQLPNLSNALPVVLSSNSINSSTQFKICDKKALKSNEDYKLMDLSITGQVNIVSASCSDFIEDVSNTEYNSFLMGFNKSPDYNYGMGLRTSQQFVDHRPNELLIEQEFISFFSDSQTNPPISTNKSKNEHSDLFLLSYSLKENVSLDYYKNEQINNLCVNNTINGFEYENKNLEIEEKSNLCSSNNVFKIQQLQMNEVHDTMEIPNDHFIQGMRTYFHDYLLEEVLISENRSIDCPKHIQEILSNTEQMSSNIKSIENTNCTKRWQPQNDLHKKRKTVVQ
ncbi:uncharacterized protein LOC112680421, partial [Sipha flava]|uniref:Uncharacterized protein LOC112680421 n=1 Tax=Sipha flava TaxID=143950 RepID=A0A8B8F625_9HEMI